MKTSLENARFWVRPYEFEGDGTSGAAEDIVSLEVGGKLRTFWLKTLEGRLFFREVGRGEEWTFGALDISDDGDDLPRVLVRALESENYGRVVLPLEAPRPCLLLVARDGQIWHGAPHRPLSASAQRLPPHIALDEALDWTPKSLNAVMRQRPLAMNLPEFYCELVQTPAFLIKARWARGSHQEWKNVIRATFFSQWSRFEDAGQESWMIEWQLKSASAMNASVFHFYRQFFPSLAYQKHSSLLPHSSRRLLRFVVGQFCFVAQKEDLFKQTRSVTLSGAIHAPTHHEILESRLFLRDWISQQLPPQRAGKWQKLI